ncbi:MAG: hypothetical protein GY820_28540 [Gammaproteobacteria bacterium]|nr:hypothetical protein [Gammaproteobacteria bacterium]
MILRKYHLKMDISVILWAPTFFCLIVDDRRRLGKNDHFRRSSTICRSSTIVDDRRRSSKILKINISNRQRS